MIPGRRRLVPKEPLSRSWRYWHVRQIIGLPPALALQFVDATRDEFRSPTQFLVKCVELAAALQCHYETEIPLGEILGVEEQAGSHLSGRMEEEGGGHG